MRSGFGLNTKLAFVTENTFAVKKLRDLAMSLPRHTSCAAEDDPQLADLRLRDR